MMKYMQVRVGASCCAAVLACVACGPAKPGGPASVASSAAASGSADRAPSTAGSAEGRAGDAGAPASLAGIRDEGKFTLYQQETPLATVEYVLEADGRYRGRATISYAGQSITQTLTVAADAAGRWTRIESDGPTGKVSLTHADLVLTISHPDGTDTAKLKPGAALFENFSPALLTPVLRRHRAARGAQTIALLIPGKVSAVVDATLTREQDVARAVGGKDLRLQRWSLALAGTAIELLAEDDGRIVYISVGGERQLYVRSGYEGLLATAPEDPTLSRAEHEVVVDVGVKARMRDGVELAADVYRPRAAGKHPTIVARTPYGKQLNEIQARYFARRGYAYVAQDVRGRYASGGAWTPFVNEKRDGFDTIEWAANQPWSSGKVGMIGPSYLGWVQYLAAVEKPPHLVTIIPNVAPPDAMYNAPYEHGAFFLLAALWWAEIVETGAAAELSGATFEKIANKKYSKLLAGLPVVDLDEVVLGRKNKFWREWIAHPTADAYWAGSAYLDRLSRLDLPVFIQSGWFDDDGIGSKLAYARLVSSARVGSRKPVKLVLGPWGHTDTATRQARGRDFGPQAVAIDLQREYLRWFDRWLKGIANGIDKEPLVSIFAMGSNRWLRGDRYPLEGAVGEKWYLSSGGKANGLGGDGKLGREPPAGADRDTYVYDPGDPTPAPSYYEAPERTSGQAVSQDDEKREQEAHHDKVLASRRDILVYVSEPMAEDTTFAGPVSAVLYASTTAKDTDWYMTLVEVGGDGKPFQLVQGRMRARYRASVAKPTLVTPGKVEKYTLDLWQTAITIARGSRLRVEIASAAFPIWSRNLNTGGHNEAETAHVPATQTILHSAGHPSHVLLPRMPSK